MRAKPFVTFSLVAAGALALPGTAAALGLGKLTVESALGQPLSARIDLTTASKDELDSLTAKVADPGLYRQNNLTYQGTLARTRITLESANGSPFLRVTSPVSVQEPYLDLMVELNWASGRVVREYTFLLDPPGTGSTMMAAEPVAPARAGNAAVAARAGAARTEPLAATRPPQGTPDAGDGSYTVKRGDTLSKIATQVKPVDITLDQMLVAMFRANENAFDGRNMNRLRTGSILSVPSVADAAATQPGEATKLVHVQAADWRAYRDRVAASAPAAEGAGSRAAGGRIGTAVAEATPAAAPGRDQVRVSRDARSGKAGAGEDVVAEANQLREAQARIAELEKMVQNMQHSLELRNPAMAQLQNQADAAKGKAAPPATSANSVAAPITTANTAPSTPANAVEPAKPAGAALSSPPTGNAEPAKAAEPPAVDARAAAETKAAVETAKDAVATPAPVPAAAAPVVAADAAKTTMVDKGSATISTPKAGVTPRQEAPGFFEDLLGNVPGWTVGGGLLAILAGIAALIAARRRKTTRFEDSIISGTDIKTNTVFGSTGGGVVNTGENSLASDFSREGLGNIDTDEVDPIAEAEVYLAYGRDAQAEEILKDALKKDPQRQEIYLKLLEIHAQHNKPSAFETVASELYAVSQGQGEVWQKAVALGRQLDPNNPMFAEGGAPAAPVTGRAVDTLASPAAVDDYIPEPVEHAERPLDNMIDDEISISPTSGARPKSNLDILAGAEHSLERTPLAPVSEHPRVNAAEAAGAATAALAGALAASKASLESMSGAAERSDARAEAPKYDLDFHLDDADRPVPLKPRAEPREPALVTEAVGAAPQLTRPSAALELDKLDLSFDPDRSTFEDPTPSVLDGQWHDAATKLDLAKAYQEMGDLEGAREILQEVLHEGDEQQKSEAQGLLGKLG
jgi:pilus assembly protein FimV